MLVISSNFFKVMLQMLNSIKYISAVALLLVSCSKVDEVVLDDCTVIQKNLLDDDSKELMILFESSMDNFNLFKQDIINIPIKFYLFTDVNNDIPLNNFEIKNIVSRLNLSYQKSKINFVNCFSNQTVPYFSDFYHLDFDNKNIQYQIKTNYFAENAINVYIVGDIYGYLIDEGTIPIHGFAYPPKIIYDLKDNFLFIDKDYMINTKTLEHELGHFFGLFHPHEDFKNNSELTEKIDGSNCSCSGDFICDTPASPKLAYWKDQIRNDGRIDVNCNYINTTELDYTNNGKVNMDIIVKNFMSYTKNDIDCRESFTPEQIKRIAFIARNKRLNLLNACNKTPTIQTMHTITISNSSAYSGGLWLNDQGNEIIAKGVCWSTSPNPTVFNNLKNEGLGNFDFSCHIQGLQSNTTYYVKAYATNSFGTGYGNEQSFTTF